MRSNKICRLKKLLIFNNYFLSLILLQFKITKYGIELAQINLTIYIR